MTAPALLAAPYSPPAVRPGEHVTCLYRDGDAVVTSWTAAPIPWPRCRAAESGGGQGLLMTDELARAVRTESAEALKYWFGVGTGAVWRWRKWAGFSGTATTPGSKAAHGHATTAGGQAMKDRGWTDAERDAIAATCRRLGRRPERWADRRWTPEQDSVLGTEPDVVTAARYGRSETAVRVRRSRLGVPSFRDRRRG